MSGIAARESGYPARREDPPGTQTAASLGKAVAIHNARGHLAVIAGFAKRLRSSWDRLPESDRVESVDAIARNAERLVRVLDEALEPGASDVRDGHLATEAFDLARQVEHVVADFSAVVPTHFTVLNEQKLPPVLGNPGWNEHVLWNLLSNAVKFSGPHNNVTVTVSRRGDMAQVAVRDDGAGIAPSDIRKLFRRFSRTGSATARQMPGSGIGLYLSKCMVEAQGGRIWAKSAPGAGSTFAYTLALATARGKLE